MNDTLLTTKGIKFMIEIIFGITRSNPLINAKTKLIFTFEKKTLNKAEFGFLF